jgi:hypothetical protein
VSGVNIAYSLNNLSDQLNDKLTIDPNTGELTLTQGLGVLDGSSHSYTIRANATYPGVFSKTITKTINFGVVKGDIENLLIDSIS